MKIKRNMYVNELPILTIRKIELELSKIELELSKIGLSNKQIKIATCSKICELSDTLPNIYDILDSK